MKPIITVAEARALASRDRVCLLDARKTGWADVHLAGAQRADLEVELSAPGDPKHGGRHPLPSLHDWCRTVGNWGITPTTPVVVYDDRGGVLAASRTWWMLRAIGHTHVAVLEGGWQAALDAGWPVTSDSPSVHAAKPYPAEQWTLRLANASRVREALNDPAWTVVDVRAPERFAGVQEPYDPVAGHIAGAINLPCANNLDDDGTFKSAAALARDFAAIDPVRTIVSCGSGVTACHTLLAMDLAGKHGAALYVGSWSEWCRNGWPGEP